LTEPDLLRHTGHLLRRAQQLHQVVWTRDVSAEISSVQFAALVVLARRPDASQRDLGRALDLDRSTIADLVKRMTRHGLIDCAQDATDRRRHVLRLTTRGRTALKSLRPRVDAIEPELTGALTVAERAELRRLLQRMLVHAVDQGLMHGEGAGPG
jgi:DNA-binding MarR family transcriptional regulator